MSDAEVFDREVGVLPVLDYKMGMVPIGSIVPHPDNWRVHPARQRDAVALSIDRFGVVQACTWNERTGHLLDGHLRFELAKKSGESHLFCRIVDFGQELEAEFLLACDPLVMMAGQDDAKLVALFAVVAERHKGAMDGIIGWSDKEVADIKKRHEAAIRRDKPQEAVLAAPAPDMAPKRCKPNSIWSIGSHIVVCGDSSDIELVRNALACGMASKIDVMFTDPPYSGIAASTFGGERRKGWDGIRDREMGDFDPLDWFLPSMRVWFGWAERGAGPFSAFVFCNDALQLPYMMWCRQRGGTWTTLIKRDSANPMPVAGHHVIDVEYCLWMKRQFVWNERDVEPQADRKRVIDCSVTDLSDLQRVSGHPTPKPVKFAVNQFKLASHRGDLVGDPFGGTGSTLVAAIMTGRRCIMVELDPKMCDIALEWASKMTGMEPVCLEEGDEQAA